MEPESWKNPTAIGSFVSLHHLPSCEVACATSADGAGLPSVAENIDMELTDARREHLALKGERLYNKFCGLNGEGICAESFAEYHALRGEFIVVVDFLEFLHDALERESDPIKVRITQELIHRVEALLA